MKKTFWIVLGVVTLIRIIMITFLGLGDDEAYYWVWGNNLALSYYDHPPMVGYLIWFLTWIFGNTYFAVHLGALLCVTGFTVMIYFWAKEMFSEDEAAWSALLFIFIPIFFIGGIIIAPDSPLGLFWVLSLWLIWRALKHKKSYYWYLAGITSGLGALSKYNALLIPFVIFIYLVFSPEHRFWLKKKEPYICFVLMLIAFSPVVVWNLQNQMESFGFQFESRHHGGFSLIRFLVFVGGQLVYFTPLAFIGFYNMLKGGLRNKDWNIRYLFYTSFPVVLLFAMVSFFSPSFKPHWPAFGYIGSFIAAAVGIKASRKMKKTFIINIFIYSALLAILIVHSFYLILPIDPKQDITNDLYGWKELGEEIKALQQESSRETFLLAERYQTGAPLSFASLEEVWVLHPTRKTGYQFWQREEAVAGKDALYFTHSRYFTPPDEIYKFGELKWKKEIPVYRNGKAVRMFYIYYLSEFGGVR
ncbi:MAG: glycosyltransferase family 39 protein [bacterium]